MDAHKESPGREGGPSDRSAVSGTSRPRVQPLACQPGSTSAFTLVEILVTASIIAVLITMVLTGGPRMIAGAKSAACASNLRGIQSGLTSYAVDNNNCLPPAYASGVAWVQPVWPYLSQGAYQTEASKRRGVTYCPSTAMNGEGIYKRDRATWRTDYEVNPNVMSTTLSANNLANIPGRLVLSFDSGGGASGNSAVSGDSRASKRHNDCFNALFVDGHIESLTTFTNGHSNDWKKP